MPVNGINPSAALNAYSNSGALSGQGNITTVTKSTLGSGGADSIRTNAPSFSDFMENAVTSSVETMEAGEKMSAEAITGDADLTDVVQAVTAAELTLQTVVSVRDRMISAYQEIMRMPI